MDLYTQYDVLGIWPQCDEDNEQFVMRAQKLMPCKTIDQTWNRVYTLISECYGFSPTWVSINFSDKNLNFLEAGATFIGPLYICPPYIHVRKDFKENDRFLWYSRDEVIAHELVHAIRAPLHSDVFEEHFAYFTSKILFKNRFRSFFGPLFQNSYEILGVIGTLLCAEIATIYFENFIFCSFPIVLLFYFFVRLVLRWNLWYKCLDRIEKFCSQREISPLHLMVRLTDDEIYTLVNTREESVGSFLKECPKAEIRFSQWISQF